VGDFVFLSVPFVSLVDVDAARFRALAAYKKFLTLRERMPTLTSPF
jgi:hypothetical protein